MGYLQAVIKNSGLIVRASPVYGITLDGAGRAEFGSEPDIVVVDGESELDTCLKSIKKQEYGSGLRPPPTQNRLRNH